MPHLEIHPKDNVDVYVTSEDQGVLHDLRDHLTFFADGYQHHPKFRFGTWDGKIKLYSLYDKTTYRGLVERIVEWAEDFGHTVSVDGELTSCLQLQPEQLHAYVERLNLTNEDGDPITPHTFQYLGVYYGITEYRHVFEASTAGGKSLIMYMISRFLLDHNLAGKILIVTDGQTLVGQLYQNFEDYALKTDWFAEENVHEIYTGQEKDVGKPIYISTWQSMAKMGKEYLSQFDAIFIDEAHKVQAKSFKHILTNAKNALWRIGLTGTMQDALVHRYVIEGLLGPHKLLLTNLEARELGITTPIEVRGVVFEYSEEERRALQKICYISPAERKAGKKDKSYQHEIKYIIEHEGRNRFMTDFAAQLPNNSIMLFNRIDHGTTLLQLLQKNHGDRDIFWVSGDVEKDEREELRLLMANQTNAIIVASYGVFSQGVDIKNLHNLLLCHPLESPRLLLQSLGRLGRKHSSKDVARTYHFGDNLKAVRKNAKDNHTLRHFKNCINRYDREQIPYELSRFRLS